MNAPSGISARARHWLAERGWHSSPPDNADLDAIRAEIDEELRFHIDEAARALERDAGLSAHEAFTEALARFGDLGQIRRACARQRMGETLMIQRMHFLFTVVLGLIAAGSVASLVIQGDRADAADEKIRFLGASLEQLRASLALERRDEGPVRRNFDTLAVGDRIRVRSETAPQGFEGIVVVARDGKALFRYLGWVDAAGRSLDALERELEEAYEPYSLNQPSISLFLESAAGTRTLVEDPLVLKIGDEFVVRSTSHPGSLDLVVEVADDGAIWLPVIGRLQVAGTTRADLERDLSERHRPFHLENVEIWVIVQ